MAILQSKMRSFDPVNTLTYTDPLLENDEKRVIIIVHDESTVYANDFKKVVWNEEGLKQIRPKSCGKSIMISAFCCECHGIICGDQKSYVLFEAGKSRQGYWCNKDLVQQFANVIPIFKDLHPDCDLVFAFDNSQNHHAMADNALVASRLNLSDGGSFLLRETTFVLDGEERIQSMQLPGGKQKGVRTILMERSLWPRNKTKFNLLCKVCKDGEETNSTDCCARKLLSSQPDFIQQKIWLHETALNNDVTRIFFPKFHCELNFIELIWAYLKAKLRKTCDFQYSKLVEKLPNEIESIPLEVYKRSAIHGYRFMDGYRKGLTGPLLDYAMKKYKSHRAIPNVTLEDLENMYKKHKESKK